MNKAVRNSLISLLVVSVIFVTTLAIGNACQTKKNDAEWSPCLVTDASDIDDKSFNEEIYKGGRTFCDEHGISWNYYKPALFTSVERKKSVELAINRGHNVIFLPGYTYARIIYDLADLFPKVKFVGIDITMSDFYNIDPEYELPVNVCIVRFNEEIAGFLAGYAIVKEGFTELGYLGGQEVDSVKRYGYGYVQGIDYAAKLLDKKVYLKYVYGGQYYGDLDINKYMDNWYKDRNHPTNCVFACGGSIYTSAALAAKDNNGHVIGVDVDQKSIIDSDYGDGICVTSAIKKLANTVYYILSLLVDEKVDVTGNYILGLKSDTDDTQNFVGLPTKTWCLKNMSVDEYYSMLNLIFTGKITISDNVSNRPTTSDKVEVNWCGSIK